VANAYGNARGFLTYYGDLIPKPESLRWENQGRQQTIWFMSPVDAPVGAMDGAAANLDRHGGARTPGRALHLFIPGTGDELSGVAVSPTISKNSDTSTAAG